MYVRLGFAVAAHLDSEILLADEVLAVGDQDFQKKCLGKMEDVSKNEGRTVLFVSHNMGAVKRLCSKGMVLGNGFKEIEGEISDVSDYYSSRVAAQDGFKPFEIGSIGVKVLGIALNSETGGHVLPGKPLRIVADLEADREVRNIGVQFMISNDDTTGTVFSTNSYQTKSIETVIRKGRNRFTCDIRQFNLCSGRYMLGFAIDVPFVRFYFHDLAVMSFEVQESLLDLARLPTLPAYGHVYLDHEWHVEQ
jgi:lipopolysaccharide transport system ATP-binding protein